MNTILTIDAGTTSIRGILYDFSGRPLAVEQYDNPPRYFPDGRVEQDPSTWLDGMRSILKACSFHTGGSTAEIAAVALTAQRSSVIPVDKDGSPLRPAIMWQDKRAEGICLRMEEHQSGVFAKTGAKISPVFSAPKIRWIRDNEPEVYKRTYKMVGIQDFLIRRLTGRFVTDHTFASRTNLMNLTSRSWDEELLRLFGVGSGLLCDLVPPGSVAGTLTAEAAAEAGLPPGLPVVSAGGDQNCAALGLGVFSQGTVVANTGTGSYLIAHTDKPVFDSAMRLSCNASAVPGAFILEAAVLTSGSVYRWFANSFYRLTTDSHACFEQINADAEAAPAGAHGVMLFPYFKGSGSPRWNPKAKGAFLNLSLSTTRAEMARAILEGIAAELKENLLLIEDLTGPARSVSVSGGLAAFGLYNGIQADVMGKTVILHHFKEATSLGAWMSAVRTLGIYNSFQAAFETVTAGKPPSVFTPDPERTRRYEEMWKRRKTIADILESQGIYDLMDSE